MDIKLHKPNKLEFLLIFLCSLIPIFLISGPFLPDLAVTLIAIILLINLKKYFYIFEDRNFGIFFYLFLLFFITINISSFFSEHIYESFKSSLGYLRFLFLIFCFHLISKLKFNFEKLIMVILIIIYLIFFIDSNIQFFFNKNLVGYELLRPNNMIRVSSFFGDELVMGSFISRFLPIISGLIFLNIYGKKKYFLFYIILAVSCYLVFLSGEKLAFLYILLFIIMFLFFIDLEKIHKLLIIFSLFISIAFLISIQPQNRIIKTFSDIIFEKGAKQNVKGEDVKIFNYKSLAIQYQAHYISAYKMFLDKPFFGHGIKSFRKKCDDPKFKHISKKSVNLNNQIISYHSCSTHPHNIYLQLLSETGIFSALIIFFIFLYSIFILFKKTYFENIYKDLNILNYQKFLMIGLFINFFPLFPSGSFFNNWISIIYFFLIGLNLSCTNKLSN